MRGCCLLALTMAPLGGTAATEKAPSFVFMMLDDVGWADFGFMGSNSGSNR